MKADIEWVERLDNGLKRKIRITFESQNKIKWQFKRSDEPRWDYTTPPSADDWTALEEKVENFYNRRRISFDKLELVRVLKKSASSKTS